MRALIILSIFVKAGGACLAQGYISFANYAGGGADLVDAPVTNAAGDRIAGPGPFVAGLFWSSDTNAAMDSLAPVGALGTFLKDPPGYFQGPTVSLPEAPFLQPVLVQVRVWDTTYGSTYDQARDNGGEFGFSNLILVIPNPSPTQPATPLLGLEGFQLQVIPEPSMAPMLLVGGCLAWFSWRRRA